MILTRRNKRAILGFLAVVLMVGFILISAGRFLAGVKDKQRFEQEREELKPPEPESVMVVDTSPVRIRDYSSEILPWMEARVPAEVPGRVLEAPIEAGTVVRAGDVLVRLDAARSRIALDLAQARHEEALRLFGEAERLQKSRVVSQTQYESVRSEVRITKAQVADAQDNLERHTIRAPFDGVVNERLVEVGDAVSVSEAVATVVDLSKLRVRFAVAEAEIGAFPPGRPVKLRVLSAPRESLEPRVAFVARSADPGTGLFRVEALLDNADRRFPGGLQGEIEAEVQVFPRGPVVPAAAVRFTGRDAYVLKDEGGEEPVLTRIVVGPEVDGVFPVLEGLKAGDRLYVR